MGDVSPVIRITAQTDAQFEGALQLVDAGLFLDQADQLLRIDAVLGLEHHLAGLLPDFKAADAGGACGQGQARDAQQGHCCRRQGTEAVYDF